jgi:hypothetical protein
MAAEKIFRSHEVGNLFGEAHDEIKLGRGVHGPLIYARLSGWENRAGQFWEPDRRTRFGMRVDLKFRYFELIFLRSTAVTWRRFKVRFLCRPNRALSPLRADMPYNSRFGVTWLGVYPNSRRTSCGVRSGPGARVHATFLGCHVSRPCGLLFLLTQPILSW